MDSSMPVFPVLYHLLELAQIHVHSVWCHPTVSFSVIQVKASARNVGDLGSIPESGRSPGEENGNPVQHSCLENPMDKGVWWATVHGVAKSRTRLSDFTFTFNLSSIRKIFLAPKRQIYLKLPRRLNLSLSRKCYLQNVNYSWYHVDNIYEENIYFYITLKHGATKTFKEENKDCSELTLTHIWLYLFLFLNAWYIGCK